MTKTKCLKDPSHAIFSKSREFKDIRYDAYNDKDNKTIKDGDISPRPLGHNCPYGPMVRFDQRDWREHIYWLDQSYRKDPQARASCDASLHAFGAQAMATQNIFPSIRATGPMAWGSLNPLGQPWLLVTIPLSVLVSLGQSWSVLVSLGQSWSVLVSLGHSWSVLVSVG